MPNPSAYIAFETAPGVPAAYGSYYTSPQQEAQVAAVFGNINLMGNYDDDAAAAAAGVQIGQAYMNGNFVMVRES
jgi:hypothetical protein